MNWTFFNMTRRIEFFRAWVKELDFWVFLKKNDSKNWAFTKNTIQRTELFFFSIWLKDFFQYDSKNWTLLYNMTQRLGFFHQKKNSKNLTSYDSQTWTFFSKYFSKKWLEELIPFFSLWLSKWNFFFEVRIRITELFFFSIRITELNFFFLNMTFFFQNWIIFFEYDSKNWNSPIRLRGFNYFLRYDSKNWTFLVFQCDSMNSLRKTGKKFNALRQVRKKLNSSSQIIKGSILWVQIQKKKKVQFFESCEEKFNFEEKNQFFVFFSTQISIESHSKKWDRFIESYSKKVSSILLSHTQKKVQFFESYFWKKSILWVIFKKKKRR